jgi:hypothetical protein
VSGYPVAMTLAFDLNSYLPRPLLLKKKTGDRVPSGRRGDSDEYRLALRSENERRKRSIKLSRGAGAGATSALLSGSSGRT